MYSINHAFGIPVFAGFGAGVAMLAALVIVATFAVLILLKGYALWHAAKREDKGWFIAILLINTAGILELVYLIFIVKKWPQILPKKGDAKPDSTITPPPSAP